MRPLLYYGDDLILQPLASADAAPLFAVIDANRAYLREWLPWLDRNGSVEDTIQFIESCIQQADNNDGFHCGVWLGSNLIGCVGLHHIDWPNRSTSIGYWLAQSRQGRGLVTRSCCAVVNYAFEALKLHRVEIRCAVGNRKSRAIAERLGFRDEGVRREAEWLYDHFVDLVVYGMLAHEWKASPGSSITLL